MSVQKAIAGRALVIPLTINIPVGDLLVPVSDAQSGQKIKDAEIKVKGEHNYDIVFTPPEAGTYKMEICVKGTTKQTVTISADPAPYLRLIGNQLVPNAIVGQQVEFKIEYPVGTVTSDQIEAAFRDSRGQVTEPTQLVSLGSGVFALRFTPKKPGKYTTKVAIKGAGTMDGQLEIEAQNAPGIQLIEGGSGLATVGKPFTFKLSAPSIKINQLNATITTPNGRTESGYVSDLGDGIFGITCTPALIGKYSAELKLDGGLISKPLTFDSRSDVKWLSHLPSAKGELIVGKEFEFNIELNEVTPSSAISVGVMDSDLREIFHGNLVHVGGKGNCHQFSLKWKPPRGGAYSCQIKLDGLPLGERVGVYATEPKADTGGKNTSKGKLGNTFNVTLTLEDMESKKIEAVVVTEADGKDAGRADVQNEGHGKYKLSYKPTKTGMHVCTLVIDGVPIAGSDLFFDVQ